MAELIDEDDKPLADFGWQVYTEMCPPPHMTREQYDIKWAFNRSGEHQPTDPMEWGRAAMDWARNRIEGGTI